MLYLRMEIHHVTTDFNSEPQPMRRAIDLRCPWSPCLAKPGASSSSASPGIKPGVTLQLHQLFGVPFFRLPIAMPEKRPPVARFFRLIVLALRVVCFLYELQRQTRSDQLLKLLKVAVSWKQKNRPFRTAFSAYFCLVHWICARHQTEEKMQLRAIHRCFRGGASPFTSELTIRKKHHGRASRQCSPLYQLKQTKTKVLLIIC